MSIKVGTFSGFNVSSSDSGKLESSTVAGTKSSGRSKDAPSRTTSSRSRSSRAGSYDSFNRGDLSLASQSAATLSNAIQSATAVHTYDSTIYDNEITGSGITSAYPVIIGTLPITNLYERGGSSNTGTLFDIQNEIKDQSVSLANEIVSAYYEKNSSAAAELALIRDSNNAKISSLLNNIPGIVQERQNLISASKLKSRSSENQYSIDYKSSTTAADFASALGIDLPEGSLTYGDFGNRTVAYVDDDITKYEDSVFDKLEKKLLGTNEYPRNEQANTTRQYQVLKAAYFQSIEGKNLGTVESTGIKSPYENLEYFSVASLADYTATSIGMNPSLSYAKATLEFAASLINNDYFFDGEKYKSVEQVEQEKENYGIFHGGIYAYNPESKTYTRSKEETGSYYVNYIPVDLRSYSDNYGTISILRDRVTPEFIGQIFVSLASEIMQKKGSISTSANLPEYLQTSGDTVQIQDTVGENPRYIAETRSTKNIALFDPSLVGVDSTLSPISDVILLGTNFLENVKSEIELIESGIDDFVSKNKGALSNQCALTIMRTFYSQISNYLKVSVLGTDDTDGWSAVRTISLLIAANDDAAAARLFRMINSSAKVPDDSVSGGSIAYHFYNFTGYNGDGGTGQGRLVTDLREDQDEIRSIKVGPESPIKKGYKAYSFDVSTADDATITDKLFDPDGIFLSADTVVSTLNSYYGSISSDSRLQNKIKLAYFTVLLSFLRKIGAKIELTCEWKSGEIRFRGFIKFHRSDTSFLADCLDQCAEVTQVSDVDFDFYSSVIGEDPISSETDSAESIFTAARSPVKSILQIYQDIRSLLAYQKTVLDTQYDNISKILNYHQNLANLYGGDTQKAALIASRYASIESCVELISRTSRFQSVIPGTSISQAASRSSNYRALIKSAYKDLIPRGSDLRICMVGIPYGHLELLRLAQDEATEYFGARVFADDVRTINDEEKDITYQFNYIGNSETRRPNLGGPYWIYCSGVQDQFDSSIIPESVSDDSISLQKVSFSETVIPTIYQIVRSAASDNQRAVDFPAYIVQAALESYLEEIYGLYPRYASTKGPLRTSEYPEERYADNALQAAGYNFDTENTDSALLYARIRSTIMMHSDFVTTRLLEEIEASPLFDKILYVLFSGEDMENIITEVYTKVEV